MEIEKSGIGPTPQTFKLPKAKHRKFIVMGVLAVLVLILVVISNALPLSAKVFTLHLQDFTKGFTEEGEIIAAQEWSVVNPVEGELQTLKVKNGAQVKKGQVLFEMSTSDLNYQLKILRAQTQSLEGQRSQSYKSPYGAQVAQQQLIIQQAEKDVQSEELNLSRLKDLYDAAAISLVQYEEAQTTLEKAKNILDQQRLVLQLIYEQLKTPSGTEMYYDNQKKVIEAQINQVQDKITMAVVVAHQDGIIKDITLIEGNVLPQGQKIMTVFAKNQYKLESYVLASDALDIKVGSSVQLIQGTSTANQVFEGKVETVAISAVERISPLGLKENRVKITILLDESSPVVVLGSNVDVKYTTVKVPGKLLIPKTALFPYQEGEAVWVIQQGKAKIQAVKKGQENDSQVIIEEGLSEGALILRDPNLKDLKEGKGIKAEG